MNEGKIFIDVKGIVPKVGETLFKSPINFTIKEGECWTIYGPNGSGKTLLSEVLCGRHLLKAGSIDYPFLEDLRSGAQEYVYPRRYIHTVGFQSTYDLSDFRDAYYQQRFNSQDADIFEAHLLLVDDKMFVGAVEKGIREDHYTADYALYQATEHFAAVFSGMEDEYLRERGADIRDVASRIMDNLSEAHNHEIGMDDRRIIVGNSLSPSETAQLDQGKVLGFAVETGSATCHAAILARSMKLPAVVGIPPELPDSLSAADKLILDGYTGKIIINPDARTEEAYRLKAEAAGALYNKLEQERRSVRRPPTASWSSLPPISTRRKRSKRSKAAGPAGSVCSARNTSF